MDFDDGALDLVPIAGRSLDIELGADLVSVDLDNLDPDPNDIIELLKEANSSVWVWTRVAGEYWRKGMKDGAELIVRTVKSCTSCPNITEH
jgi:RNA polymerase-associated protein CTR9